MGAPKTAIVDYGTGNLYNVRRACQHVGLPAAITADPEAVLSADAVVLPGVGSMSDAVRALDESGLSDALREVAARGTPLFGVCLGMQLLMAEGSEFGRYRGLGIVPGSVVRFPDTAGEGVPLKVPHIGWNTVHRAPEAPADPWAGSPLEGMRDGEYMYFVHSYCVVPDDPAVRAGLTRYAGVEFCSALSRENVFGCQFHPERSGAAGLAIYERFARDVVGRRSLASI